MAYNDNGYLYKSTRDKLAEARARQAGYNGTNAWELYAKNTGKDSPGETPGADGTGGNFGERAVGTVFDISDKLSQGAFKSLEGIFDFLWGNAALYNLPVMINTLTGGDWADKIKDKMAYDITGNVAGWINDTTHMDELIAKTYQVGSFGEGAQKIETAVGMMVPAIVASVVTAGAAAPAEAAAVGEAASLITMGMGAAGNASEEAYNDGADPYLGSMYGVASGAVEVATEKMFGAAGKAITGAGWLDGVVSSVAPKLGEVTSHGVGRLAKNAVEEGLEEVVSGLVSPITKTIYKGSDALKEYGTGDFYKGLGEEFLLGAGTSMAYSGTVGYGLSRRGVGHVGKEADVVTMAEDIVGIDETMENLRKRGHLTESRAAEMEQVKRNEIQRMSNVLESMSETKRAKLMGEVPLLAASFEADGTIKQATARRFGIGVSEDATALRSTYFKGDREAVAETLKRVGAVQVSDNLTASERASYAAFVRETASFDERLGSEAPSWVVVESMSRDVGAYDRGTNTIVISREALADPGKTAQALERGYFGVAVEEYIHRVNKSDVGKSYVEMFGLFTQSEQNAVLDALVEDGYLDEYAENRSEQKKLLDRIMNKNNLTEQERRVQEMVYDEMIAHLMRSELSQTHFYQMVAAKKPGILQRIYDRIRAMGKSGGKVGEAVSERTAKAEKLFLEALSEVGYTVQDGKIIGIRDEDDDEVRAAKKKADDGRDYFAEAVERNGMDFDDRVMSDTREEAERRYTESQTHEDIRADKDGLNEYIGRKRAQIVLNRAVQAMIDINTVTGDAYSSKEIVTMKKAVEKGISETLWEKINMAKTEKQRETAVGKVVDAVLQQARLRVMASDEQVAVAARQVSAIKRYYKRIDIRGEDERIKAMFGNDAAEIKKRWGAENGQETVSPEIIADELNEVLGEHLPWSSIADLIERLEYNLRYARDMIKTKMDYAMSDVMTDEVAQETKKVMVDSIMNGLKEGMEVSSVERIMKDVMGAAKAKMTEATRKENDARAYVEGRLKEAAEEVKKARENGAIAAKRAFEAGRGDLEEVTKAMRKKGTEAEVAQASARMVGEGRKAFQWNVRSLADADGVDIDGLDKAARLVYAAFAKDSVSAGLVREAAFELDVWLAENAEKTGWIAEDAERQTAREVYKQLYAIMSNEGSKLTAAEMDSMTSCLKWLRGKLGTVTAEQMRNYKNMAEREAAKRRDTQAYARASGRVVSEANRTRQWMITSLAKKPGVDAAGLADVAKHLSNAVSSGTIAADKIRNAALDLYDWLYDNAEKAGWTDTTEQKQMMQGAMKGIEDVVSGVEGRMTETEMQGFADALAFVRDRVGTQNLEGLYEQVTKYMEQTERAIEAKNESVEYQRRLLSLTEEAQKFKNWVNSAFVNQNSVQNQDIFKGSLGRLGHLLREGNLNVKALRREFANVSEWFEAQAGNLGLWSEGNTEATALCDQVLEDMKAVGLAEGKLTAEELEKAEDVLKFLRHQAECYNKVRRDGKLVDAVEVIKPMMEKMKRSFDHATQKNNVAGVSMRYLEHWGRPESVVKLFDSYQEGAWFTDAYERMQQAELDTAVIQDKLMSMVDEFDKKHKNYIKDAEKRTMTAGNTTLPAPVAMGMYMTLHRDQAIMGLLVNGFEYFDKQKSKQVDVQGMLPNQTTMDEARVKADEIIAEIKSQMTEVDAEWAKMAEAVYEACKERKRVTDMNIYGYTNIVDGWYYPIKRVGKATSLDESYHGEVNRATNASFNKSTVEGAKNKLLLEPVDTVLARHIDGIARYAGMAEFIREYDLMWNLNVSGNPNRPETLNTLSRNVWPNANKYMKNLMEDIQGIKTGRNESVAWMEALRGTYAVFTLGLNPKVLATQFSSVMASTSILDWSDLGAAVRISGKNVDEYSDIARLRNKENGAVLAATVLDKIRGTAGKLMEPIGKFDRFVITRTFAACQANVAKNGGPAVGTVENLQAAGKLLDKVITKTQQNSAKSLRSAGMREGGSLQKTLTMFSADSMMLDGQVIDAIGEYNACKKMLNEKTLTNAERAAFERQKKAAGVKEKKAIGAMITTALYGSVISMLFRKLLWKDDKDTLTAWSGDDIGKLTGDLGGNLIGGMPILKEIYNFMIDGWEVDDMSVSALNDLMSSARGLINTAGNLASGKASQQETANGIRKMMYAAGEFTGVPVRNINNYTRVLVNIIGSPDALYKYDNMFVKMPYSSDLTKAIEAGDEDRAAMIAGLVLDERTELATHSDVRKELVRLAVSGRSVLPRSVPETVVLGDKEYKMTARQRKVMKSVYVQAGQAAQSMVQSAYYNNLSDDAKAMAMKRIYEVYYNLGIEKALGIDTDNTVVLMSKAVPVEKLICIIAAASELEADVGKDGKIITGSKRKKVQQYVQSLKLTAAQKYLIYGYLGYQIGDAGKRTVRQYINGLRLTAEAKGRLYEAVA